MLHKGEKLKIECPAYLALGGAEVYSHFDSFRIPNNTPLTFELEVMNCESSKKIKDFNKGNEAFGVAVVKKHSAAEKGPNQFVGSGMKSHESDNTHDAFGTIKRSGGGDSAGFNETVRILPIVSDTQVAKAKTIIVPLNMTVAALKKISATK